MNKNLDKYLGKYVVSDFIKTKAKVIEITDSIVKVQYKNKKIRIFFYNCFSSHNPKIVCESKC